MIIKTILYIFSIVTICCSCTVTTNPENNQSNVIQEQDTIVQDVVEEIKSGVVFFDITFEQALKKAKDEGKYVFINFHTKNCSPCKKMEKEVLSNLECGSYINKNFVPIILDGEDNAEGKTVANKYKTFIYPTYLILDPLGNKVGEIIGAEFNIKKYMGMLKEIIKE